MLLLWSKWAGSLAFWTTEASCSQRNVSSCPASPVSGKFICITPDEMESVKKFICQRGRVSIADLAVESNR